MRTYVVSSRAGGIGGVPLSSPLIRVEEEAQ